jgi:predicted ATP-dependent serine protease
MLLMYGPPGSGKSTLALQIISQLSPVVIAALEEGPGPPLARRLSLAGMGARKDVVVHPRPSLGDLLAAAGRGSGIVVDSISLSALQPNDLRGIVDAGCPLLIGVLHATKSGEARGSLSLIHECDVVVKVEHGRWITEKNRYGPSGVSGNVRGVGVEENREGAANGK